MREMAIIKILESGVHLCLKLQTSHIASIYFEKWIAIKASQPIATCWCFGKKVGQKGETGEPDGK